jgi:predicted  nucleic acid-binding Zn-ribbon protein
MPHQCVHCSKIIEAGSKEIFEGCSNCKGKFFFYIRDEQVPKILEAQKEPILEFTHVDKAQVEKDVRSILKIEDETKPVILDLESVRVLSPGKFELDLVSLLNRKPIIFKLEEGKYIIDLESSMPSKPKEKK